MRKRKKASYKLAILQRAATVTTTSAVAAVAVSLSWLLVCRGCSGRQLVGVLRACGSQYGPCVSQLPFLHWRVAMALARAFIWRQHSAVNGW